MSAEDDFGLGEDLEALLNESPAPKKPAAKRPAAKTADPTVLPTPAPSAQIPTPAATVAPADPAPAQPDLRILLAEMRAELRAEIRAELRAELALEAKKSAADPGTVDALVASAPTAQEGKPGEGRLIHFLDDGLTIGGRIFYRGEEFIAPADAKWAQASGREQVLRYGRLIFRPGPWDGDGYDLTDPNLTEIDRLRLVEAERQRAALVGAD